MLANPRDFVDQFRYGNMDIIRFVHQHGYKLPESVMNRAVTYGHTELVKFLHKLGNPIVSCTTEVMDHVSFRRNLDVVQFLHENQSKGCTADATDSACGKAGSLEVVQFLHEHRREGLWSSHSGLKTLARAASCTRTELMWTWLQKWRSPLSTRIRRPSDMHTELFQTQSQKSCSLTPQSWRSRFAQCPLCVFHQGLLV